MEVFVVWIGNGWPFDTNEYFVIQVIILLGRLVCSIVDQYENNCLTAAVEKTLIASV